MKHAFFAVIAIFLAMTGPVSAKDIFNDEVDVPFIAFVACAGDGNGEFVEGVSQFHFALKSTKDASGNGHLGFYKHPKGPVAMGQKTRTIYGSDKMSRLNSDTTKTGLPFTENFWYNFRMSGPVSGTPFNVSQLVRVTVNDEGQLRAEATKTRVSCPTPSNQE